MSTVQASIDDSGIATIKLDDGAKNALDTTVFKELTAAFDQAADSRAIVLTGREGIFSAGLNVKIMPTLPPDELHALLTAFGRTLLRVWTEPRPVVAAVTGHAIAAGTMFAMACDHTVAASGDYYWGLTETQIGLPIPRFGIELSRANVRADRLEDLLLPGARIDAIAAVEAGYADELADADKVLAHATEKAEQLATLPLPAYAATKHRLHGAIAKECEDQLAADINDMLGIADT